MRAFEAELGQLRPWTGILRGAPFAVLAYVRLHLHHHLQRIGRTGDDLEAVLDRTGAAARRDVGAAHRAGQGRLGAVQLEEDGFRRRAEAAVFAVLLELAAQDVAVVAETIGEVAVAGVEPHAGEILVAEPRRRGIFSAGETEAQQEQRARHG